MSFKDLIYTQVIPFIDGYVIQLLYAVAFLFFVFGLFKFFFTGGEENRQKGKQFAVFGLLGLVVLFSVWSLVRIVLGSVFPSGAWGTNEVGNVPPGGICSISTECRSGVCVKRGLYSSTCE